MTAYPRRLASEPALVPQSSMPWIAVAPDAPYFVTETGEAWTPIGQNDAITWPDIAGLFQRRDVAAVDRHLAWLVAHGVTCLRVMLEYAQGEHRYFERPVGTFQPNMVRFWDDLFAQCEKHGLRLLLTPFDTFWMLRRWRQHPYSAAQGGPCERTENWLASRGMIDAIKNRLTFATTRWGGSGALFAWDLWNEIDPRTMDGDVGRAGPVIAELSEHVRSLEQSLYGRSHPQTVSAFAPTLDLFPDLAEPIFRHPSLDFASTHLYAPGTIDYPRNSVEPAVKAGEMVRDALAQAPPRRPFFDTEHGPIDMHAQRRFLAEADDDEDFRHVQWAHLASGGVGGGMRWPYRHPHVLTHGMRRAQMALVGFLPLIDWPRFDRRNLNAEADLSSPDFAVFACADEVQAVAWLLRRDGTSMDGRRVDADAPALDVVLRLPGMRPGRFRVTAWDTVEGREQAVLEAVCEDGTLSIAVPPTVSDVALAIRWIG